MTSKETINYLLGQNFSTEVYEGIYNILGDLKKLDLFKKYFVGISQEKGTGRWFIDMRELEGSDLAILRKLCKEGFEND